MEHLETITDRIIDLIEKMGDMYQDEGDDGEVETYDQLYFYIEQGQPAFTFSPDTDNIDNLGNFIKMDIAQAQSIVKAFVALKLVEQGFVLVIHQPDNSLVAFENTPPNWKPSTNPYPVAFDDDGDNDDGDNDDGDNDWGGYEQDFENPGLPLYIGWD
jgi:hypothetical protein